MLQALLRERNIGAEVDVANSVWLRDSLAPKVKAAFLDAVREEHRAAPFVRPFDDATAGELNRWVSNATRGMIPQMLDKFVDGVVLLIINAIFFEGRWADSFDPEDTRPRDFRLADGGTVQVPTMSQSTRNISLGVREGFSVARIPYADGAHAMFVLLPDEGRNLDNLAPELSDDAWTTIQAGMRGGWNVNLALPKFRLEWEAKLNDALTSLGMGMAFDPGAADFGRIADPQPERLYVSSVKHKAVLEVDEEGTKAAAATTVEFTILSASPWFHVDRPFLLAIVDEHVDMPLFLALVENPHGG